MTTNTYKHISAFKLSASALPGKHSAIPLSTSVTRRYYSYHFNSYSPNPQTAIVQPNTNEILMKANKNTIMKANIKIPIFIMCIWAILFPLSFILSPK